MFNKLKHSIYNPQKPVPLAGLFKRFFLVSVVFLAALMSVTFLYKFEKQAENNYYSAFMAERAKGCSNFSCWNDLFSLNRAFDYSPYILWTARVLLAVSLAAYLYVVYLIFKAVLLIKKSSEPTSF